MKYILLKDNKKPAYLQLYRQVRDDIVKHIYPYNSKLPSKRLLADELGISTVTVEHAYALLCDEGYVESRERSGFVVIFRETDGFAISNEHHTEHIEHNAEHTYPDFPLSVLSKTIRKVLADRGDLLLEKSPNCGCIELREAILQYLVRNRGIKIDAEQILDRFDNGRFCFRTTIIIELRRLGLAVWNTDGGQPIGIQIRSNIPR